MTSSSRSPAAPSEPALPAPAVSPALIVSFVGKGMTAQQICKVFPELSPDDIRAALLTAIERVCDSEASLEAGDPVDEIIRRVQARAGLDEDEAMALAVAETRAVRAARRRG